MKSFVSLAMKSKQVWMKSKSYDFDEIKSVFYPCEARFHHEVYFIAKLFHLPQANFIEKTTCRNKSFFLVAADGFEPSTLRV